jgi:peptidylprolyl isomerase
MRRIAIGAALALSLTAAGAALARTAADWRPLDLDNTLVIDTTKGRIVVEMSAKAAPNHVERMKTLARAHFYDGQIFHRVIGDFMAQTGDPLGTGQGGSDLPNVAAEFQFQRDGSIPYGQVDMANGVSTGYAGSLPVVTRPDDAMLFTATGTVPAWGAFCPAVLGMARQGEPNSANSQFFLMRGTERNLDHQYTAVGYVVQGQDVVMNLAVGEPPRAPDKMLSVRIAADMPAAEQPHLQVMNPAGAAFQALVAKRKKEEGEAFDICSVPLPARAG